MEASTQHLLDLIQLHCANSDNSIKTVYKLRKSYKVTRGIEILKYCSNCLEQIENKSCSNIVCKGSCSKICYFSLLPFEEQIVRVCEGTFVT